VRVLFFSLAMTLLACSGTTKAVPPKWVTVTAPAHVTAAADGSYDWAIQYSYSDDDDFVTQLAVTFALNGTAAAPTVIPAAQASSLTQGTTIKFPAVSKGKTYDYSFVLTDQSGLKSDPYTGTVTLD
jgi:hypothetical protein